MSTRTIRQITHFHIILPSIFPYAAYAYEYIKGRYGSWVEIRLCLYREFPQDFYYLGGFPLMSTLFGRERAIEEVKEEMLEYLAYSGETNLHDSAFITGLKDLLNRDGLEVIILSLWGLIKTAQFDKPDEKEYQERWVKVLNFAIDEAYTFEDYPEPGKVRGS